MIPRAALGLLALGLLLLPGPADAASWDPRLRWQTLDTAHFSIHFHQGEGDLAIEMAQVAEEVHALLSPYLRWAPRGRTQVVLVDPTDSSNGYARTVPYNQVVIYVVQPTADSSRDNYENWLWSIFVHEYTHILQIDMIGGLPQVVRWIAGRLIVPNAVMPRWLTEGYATYLETRFTAGGRGRSTYTDALVRLAALDRSLPPIDVADGFGQAWPMGSMRYLYGVRFHFEVEKKTSDAAWVDFHRRHSRGVIPFLFPSKAAFDRTLVNLWKDWREAAPGAYLAVAEELGRQGITATRRIPTRRGGVAIGPRYTADGEAIWYLHSSPKERTTVREVRRDGTGDEAVVAGAVSAPAWSVDGRFGYWSAVATTTRYEAYRDLYRYDVEAKKRKRLTRGARLRDPAPHPEGTWLVAVEGHRGQTQLVRVDLPPVTEGDDAGAGEAAALPTDDGITSGDAEGEGGEGRGEDVVITPLTAAADGAQYDGPRWDPAGERLAVSVWKPGGFRDVHVFDRSMRLLRTLSWDRAADADPAWSPDGEWLVFASDRDGIWNLYAHRWRDGSLWRITRLIGGARNPDVSPDGRHLVFQDLTADGWGLEEIAFDPASWEPVTLSPRALPAPDGGPSAQATEPLSPLEGVPGPDLPFGTGPAAAVARARQRPGYDTLAEGALPYPGTGHAPGPKEAVDVPEGVGELKRYNPMRTVLPPRYLSVFGNLTDTGAIGGISTGGNDALEQHLWAANLSYQTDSGFWGGGVGYTLNAFHPILSLGYQAYSVDYGRLWLRNDGPPAPGGPRFDGRLLCTHRYFERRDVINAGVTIPLKRDHRLSARYTFELRSPTEAVPTSADPDLVPATGSFSGITVGWAWGRFRGYAASISPENSDLLTASVDVESSFLGAWRDAPDGSRIALHRAIVSAEGRKYITLPWAHNHVLAVRLAVGATIGTDINTPTFRIGGPFGDNAYTSLPDRYYALRGYDTSSMRGDHVWVASAEYRLPLFYVERGFWTAPLWLRSVALTVFAEAGQTFDTADYAPYAGSPDGFVAFWSNTRPAVGAELVGEAVFAWGGLLRGRVGYGYGFGPGAPTTGRIYAQLGSSF